MGILLWSEVGNNSLAVSHRFERGAILAKRSLINWTFHSSPFYWGCLATL